MLCVLLLSNENSDADTHQYSDADPYAAWVYWIRWEHADADFRCYINADRDTDRNNNADPYPTRVCWIRSKHGDDCSNLNADEHADTDQHAIFDACWFQSVRWQHGDCNADPDSNCNPDSNAYADRNSYAFNYANRFCWVRFRYGDADSDVHQYAHGNPNSNPNSDPDADADKNTNFNCDTDPAGCGWIRAKHGDSELHQHANADVHAKRDSNAYTARRRFLRSQYGHTYIHGNKH